MKLSIVYQGSETVWPEKARQTAFYSPLGPKTAILKTVLHYLRELLNLGSRLQSLQQLDAISWYPRETSPSPLDFIEPRGDDPPTPWSIQWTLLKLCNLILCGASVFQVITGKLCSLVPAFILDFFITICTWILGASWTQTLELDPRT